MNKSDYDKYYKKGGTYVIPVEVFNELFGELERLSFNYEQALEDLDKKDNIINEVEIIEEDKKIEKLDLQYKDITKGINFEEQILSYYDNLQYKINEIIDYINKNEEEKQ